MAGTSRAAAGNEGQLPRSSPREKAGGRPGFPCDDYRGRHAERDVPAIGPDHHDQVPGAKGMQVAKDRWIARQPIVAVDHRIARLAGGWPAVVPADGVE